MIKLIIILIIRIRQQKESVGNFSSAGHYNHNRAYLIPLDLLLKEAKAQTQSKVSVSSNHIHRNSFKKITNFYFSSLSLLVS
jgi:hypothetical protein